MISGGKRWRLYITAVDFILEFWQIGSWFVSTELDPSETDSFRINNKEIRDEMLEFFEKGNIWYSLSDDNLITIFLIDGDKVDKIYTDVRLT